MICKEFLISLSAFAVSILLFTNDMLREHDQPNKILSIICLILSSLILLGTSVGLLVVIRFVHSDCQQRVATEGAEYSMRTGYISILIVFLCEIVAALYFIGSTTLLYADNGISIVLVSLSGFVSIVTFAATVSVACCANIPEVHTLIIEKIVEEERKEYIPVEGIDQVSQ